MITGVLLSKLLFSSINEKYCYQSTYSLADEQAVKREYAPLEMIQNHYEKIIVSLDDL